MKEEEIKTAVRGRYSELAKSGTSCCGPASGCGCGSNMAEIRAKGAGYTPEELAAIPDEANLGLGCGNPVAVASLKEGETVLDLGSGAGIDCFLAASKVGKKGKVIGVDMTAEMLERARSNAREGGYDNIEFRLGEIEHLPVADNSVDIIISNCVINLSPDKKQVFREAHRVLKPGGRLMVSDMVLLKELPQSIKDSVEAYVGCLGGAVKKGEYIAAIEAAGFKDVKVTDETSIEWMVDDAASEFLKSFNISREAAREIARSVVSLRVSGVKPGVGS
ncbi:MAG: arsenite methyltransferase [Chloroflexi bacterium]|nr:arsenite methyltransferase [Chloroflexota bacterium]